MPFFSSKNELKKCTDFCSKIITEQRKSKHGQSLKSAALEVSEAAPLPPSSVRSRTHCPGTARSRLRPNTHTQATQRVPSGHRQSCCLCRKDFCDFVFLMTSREKSHGLHFGDTRPVPKCPAQTCACRHHHTAPLRKEKQPQNTISPPTWVQITPLRALSPPLQ